MKLKIGIIIVLAIAGGIYYLLTDRGPENQQETLVADKLIDTIDKQQDKQRVDQEEESLNAKASTKATLDNNLIISDSMTAIMSTNKGDITIEFFNDLAPNTVENFVKLANDGYYDGTKFHRVIKGFMIQGGDPLTKDDTKQAMWGTGGPGYKFADEIHAENNNVVGTLSMANAGPNTNGSQFFINVADNSFLDPKHTVFGKVTAGMETVSAIEAVTTAGPDRPVEPVIITSVTVQ